MDDKTAEPVSPEMGPSLHLLLALVTVTTFVPATVFAKECRTVAGLPNGQVNASCVFPFTHKGVPYRSCKRLKKKPSDGWCSTGVDSDGVHIKGNWGQCAPDCDLDCDDEECTDKNECPIYQKYQKTPKLVDGEKNPERAKLAAQIKQKICNKKERKLCCGSIVEGTSCLLEADPSGTFIPPEGQCGLACGTPSRVIGEIMKLTTSCLFLVSASSASLFHSVLSIVYSTKYIMGNFYFDTKYMALHSL